MRTNSQAIEVINKGDYAGAANEFPRWDKAGGKVMAGLTKRRSAERALFLPPAPKSQGSLVAAILQFIASLFRRSK